MDKQDALPFIVADIGGTSARFGLATAIDQRGGGVTVEQRHIFRSGEYDSFEDVLASYLKELGELKPNAACVAIAGPVIGDRIRVTNLGWEFSIESVRKAFGLQRLELINDFGLQAYATLYLDKSDMSCLQAGTAQANAPRAVIGPGTGLGVAGLLRSGDHWLPVCGEGGHITYAPTSDRELEVRGIIEPANNHVSLEKFVSGPGLVNVHRALSQLNGEQYESLTPAEISRRAMDGADPVCVEALELFCKILGSAAGDVALILGAWGGVYLGGGILPKIESVLLESLFLESFRNKGRMREYLQDVPIYLMKGDEPALHSAAHWLYDSW